MYSYIVDHNYYCWAVLQWHVRRNSCSTETSFMALDICEGYSERFIFKVCQSEIVCGHALYADLGIQSILIYCLGLNRQKVHFGNHKKLIPHVQHSEVTGFLFLAVIFSLFLPSFLCLCISHWDESCVLSPLSDHCTDLWTNPDRG